MSERRKDLLFEIGTEEIPARLMLNILDQLKSNTGKKLAQHRLEYENIRVMGTPRRLALIVDGLKEIQEDLKEHVRGPSEDVAYDEEGNPTKAAEGFARSQGVEVDNLTVEEDKGKKYVYAISTTRGKEADKVLPEILEEIINDFEFPKMFWEKKTEKFIRPIRWLVALFGRDVLPVSFGRIKAGNYSRGHRFLAEDNIEINSPDEYEEVMKKAYVMVNHLERKETIQKQVKDLALSIDAEADYTDELLEEVNFLIEWPTALMGEFAEEYLELPDEVLITCMEKHQKYFAVKNKNGELLPYFITVRNGDDYHLDTVRKGNEKVLKARLADARFFYEEDKKTKLEDKVEELKSIVYREELGSVYEKSERLEEISATILDILEISEPVRSKTLRVSKLCKADLITQMVFEFSDLQGYMGMEYAKINGEDDEVAQGIYEHYLPRYAGDELPQTIIGTIVSLADKADNIASSFAIGLQPTGTQDPYALRRQALGMIYIVLETELYISFRQLFRKALSLIPENSFVAPSTELLEDIMSFITTRAKTVFTEYGFEGDVINSVLEVEDADIYVAYKRIKDLQEEKGSDRLEDILTSYNRVKNLAHKATGSDIHLELLTEDSERVLYHHFQDLKEEIEKHVEEGENKMAFEALLKLKEPVDDFFDNVMVMVDDSHLKENRLNLLYQLKELFHRVADFSKLRV